MTMILSLNISAAVYDLRQEGYTGTYCVGDTLSYDLDHEHVEKVLISAEGIRNDGFIKVYADGSLVQNIGVPGYDPDYSFRVRQNVSNITLKFEETCSRILDMKIFTSESSRRDSRDYSSRYAGTNWGGTALEVIDSILTRRSLSDDTLWNEFLKPLQVTAMKYDAVASVSDKGDLKAALFALSMAKLISDYQPKLLILSYNYRDQQDVRDLMGLKEDILESYDVREKSLEEEISDLESFL